MQDFDQEAKVHSRNSRWANSILALRYAWIHSPLQEVRDSMSTSTNVEPRNEQIPCAKLCRNELLPEFTPPFPKERSNYSVFLGAFVFLPLTNHKSLHWLLCLIFPHQKTDLSHILFYFSVDYLRIDLLLDPLMDRPSLTTLFLLYWSTGRFEGIESCT
jgi:hypothetical protein